MKHSSEVKHPTRRRFIQQSALLGFGLCSSGRSLLTGCQQQPFDLVVCNGLIYDGSGSEPCPGDVGIRGERIVAIGKLDASRALQIVDAGGHAVTPGFIDVHTHSDLSLLVDPRGESKIRQGVTLEIGGNCGESVFPIAGKEGELAKEEWCREYAVEASWRDLAGFFAALEKRGIGLNYATLAGHGAIRTAAMGSANRVPDAAEMRSMKTLLESALEQGALGLSTGLEYTPGSFARTDEIIALCKMVTRRGGLYATHMRNEDLTIEAALAEALTIGRESGVRVQISHLKACQQRNWHKTAGLLEAIAEARRQGLHVHADRYPYTAYATSLNMLFPLWAREGGHAAFVARLKEPATFAKMAPFVRDKITATGSWASIMITRAYFSGRRELQGRTVEELAAAAKLDPLEFTRRLLIEEEGQVGMCGFSMSEEDTRKTFAAPFTMVGSDGNAISPTGLLGQGTPHPRYYGTFPRYLGRYIREARVLPLAEAVHRITGMPADKFGIRERGMLKKGYFADLVVFDPATIIDQATFAGPHQFPIGIDLVLVNGQIVVSSGQHTGKLPGRIIRRV
ncbi:MAG TPA: D-aminoacylase [bacterium]|nr:D-aminoacylase [bacterium]HQI47034.1 D-aminoacylase [bacterium]HQJ65727.1 D-aminoacylase [bacterium]